MLRRHRSGWSAPVAGVVLLCAIALLVIDLLTTLLGAIHSLGSQMVLAGLSGAMAAFILRRKGARSVAMASFAVAAFAGTLYCWPLGPRKAFVRDVRTVELGMARDDVRQAMSAYPTGHPFGDGWWVSSRDKSPASDLWHSNSQGNTTSFDHVVVRYGEDERVVELELLLD